MFLHFVNSIQDSTTFNLNGDNLASQKNIYILYTYFLQPRVINDIYAEVRF